MRPFIYISSLVLFPSGEIHYTLKRVPAATDSTVHIEHNKHEKECTFSRHPISRRGCEGTRYKEMPLLEKINKSKTAQVKFYRQANVLRFWFGDGRELTQPHFFFFLAYQDT